ncbi:MAG: hypothetical protein ABIP65_04985 [Vicinamibacterales bacterium]
MRQSLLLHLLLLCTATVSAAQARSERARADSTPLAIGETFSIVSRTLGETRRINV